jgi:uncharacterized RDD family membrane protein YckC
VAKRISPTRANAPDVISAFTSPTALLQAIFQGYAMKRPIDGQLSLTTPEGVRLLLIPAGPAIRAYAWTIDFLLWLVAVSLLSAVLSGSRLGQGIFAVLLFASYWLYPVIGEVYCGGRTIGKRALGLEVLRSDGLPVGLRESFVRNLLLVADFLPLLYASGLLCMMLDRRFRRLGDVVARTQVVYRERRPVRRMTLDVPTEPLPFPLTPEQQRVLADLFARELRLPPARMLELATIAEPLTGRTGPSSLERLRRMAAGLAR